MSYFDRYTPEYHDHQRDLAKHDWPRAEVSSQPDPDVPGLVGHVITGFTAQEVQAEITRLTSDAIARVGEAKFTAPRRVGPRFYSFGHTQVGRPS